MSGLTGGVRKLTGAELAEQDQFEAIFERNEFRTPTFFVELTKADGASWSKPRMAAFLACLERWAKRMNDDGYRIVTETLPGPGTTTWKAVKR